MANSTNNDTGIPDLGSESIIGFQSGPRTTSRPYTREHNRRSAAVEGGSFQSSVANEQQPISKPINPAAAADILRKTK
jgi:hypothetical protein